MRKVVSNSDVAHLFALQQQSEARTPSGSFFFYGGSIYSYGHHFCIAKFIGDKLLFTERDYSNTTSKHKSYTHQATSHIEKVYCAYPDGTHQQNFDSWEQKAKVVYAKLIKARKPEIYIAMIASILDRAEKYADLFGIEIPESLSLLIKVENREQATEILRKQEQKKIEQDRQRHIKELADFRSHNQHRIFTRDGYDYLRCGKDSFETSQAVEIPMSDGIVFYKLLKEGKIKKGDKLMHWTVLEVTSKFISIGCHKIKIEEIENVVKMCL